MEFIRLNLQLFADAGSVVHTSGGYADAHSGVVTPYDGTNTLAPELKDYYDTELLENTRIDLFYAQFAKRQALPLRHGGKVEWRRIKTFARADKLVEGVIPEPQKNGVVTVSGSIAQYGTFTSLSDRLELRAYDDLILGFTEEMGASAAETQEALIRDGLLINTNVLYCDNINREAGAKMSTPTSAAEMGASDANGWSFLTPTMVNKAATILKKNKVPRINGKYYAVIHPSAAFNLRESEGWIEVHKYSATEQIFNGEIGELHGVRFIENSFAPVLGGDGYNNKEGGVTYATYFFGKDSFGIIDPEGGALQMLIKSKSEIGGPLEQFSTIGYKFETNGATILYPERMLRVMSCSDFSATDEVSK